MPDELIERLRDYALDWDGTQMSAESLTRVDVDCRTIRAAADEIERLKVSADEMAEALRDTLAYMRGDIAGPAQRDGILREANQALTAYRNGGNDEVV